MRVNVFQPPHEKGCIHLQKFFRYWSQNWDHACARLLNSTVEVDMCTQCSQFYSPWPKSSFIWPTEKCIIPMQNALCLGQSTFVSQPIGEHLVEIASSLWGGRSWRGNSDYCQPQARLKPKRCLGGFIFTLNKSHSLRSHFCVLFEFSQKGMS